MGRRAIIRKQLGTKIKFLEIGTEPVGSVLESRWGLSQRFMGSRLRLASLCCLLILITFIRFCFCIQLQDHNKLIANISVSSILQLNINFERSVRK
jgi:hypothetical protein